MNRFIEGIFVLLIGLVTYYIVSAFAGAIVSTGLTENWSSAQVLLVIQIMPAMLVFGTMASVFLGIRKAIDRRSSPDDFEE